MFLTIAIPSHNKSYLLNQALNSIIDEPALNEEIDILISDNSPSNDIKDLFNGKFSKRKNINLIDSSKFQCLDSNVNRSVEASRGEYVWIFGDDDLIVEGALSTIVSYLKENKPEVLILNSKSFKDSSVIEESRMPTNTRKIYYEKQNDEFLSELGSYLTYIGGIIVKKRLWVKYYDHSKIGTFFSHLVCLAKIKNNRVIHYLDKPAIKMRLGNQTWTNKSFMIWHKFFPEVIWSLKNYSDSAKQKVISKNPLESIKVLIASRAYKRYDFSIWKKNILISPEFKILLKINSFLVSLVPSIIFSKLYIFYIILFRNKHTYNFSPKLALAKLKYKH